MCKKESIYRNFRNFAVEIERFLDCLNSFFNESNRFIVKLDEPVLSCLENVGGQTMHR